MAKKHRARRRRIGYHFIFGFFIVLAGAVFLLNGAVFIIPRIDAQALSAYNTVVSKVSSIPVNGAIGAAMAVCIVLLAVFWARTHKKESWAAQVLGIHSIDDIYALSPGGFEQFTAFLFQRMGYAAKVVGKSGDEGIDIELRRSGNRLVAQCKRYKGTVGQPIVREFYGSFAEHAKEGFLVTTGEFTDPAKEWAASRPLKLVDGAELMRWTEQVAQKLR